MTFLVGATAVILGKKPRSTYLHFLADEWMRSESAYLKTNESRFRSQHPRRAAIHGEIRKVYGSWCATIRVPCVAEIVCSRISAGLCGRSARRCINPPDRP